MNSGDHSDTPETLCRDFEQLTVQSESSKFRPGPFPLRDNGSGAMRYARSDFLTEHMDQQVAKTVNSLRHGNCPFPACDERAEYGGFVNLVGLSKSIEDCWKAYSRKTTARGAVERILNLVPDMSVVTCLAHRHLAHHLFLFQMLDSLEKAKDAGEAKSNQPQPAQPVDTGEATSGTQPRLATPIRRPPATRHLRTAELHQYSDGEDLETPDRSQEAESFGIALEDRGTSPHAATDQSSRFTLSPDREFDHESAVGDADTPPTDLSSRSVSRVLFPRSRINTDHSPTPKPGHRSPRVDIQGLRPERDEPYDEYFASIVTGSYDDIINKGEVQKSRAASAKSRKKPPPSNELGGQEVQPYTSTPNKKTRNIFNAKGVLYDALNEDFSDFRMDEGKIYVAFDDEDSTLEGMFKVGFTCNEVYRRYDNEPCRRKHNLKFVAVSKHKFKGAVRVEKLVKADLCSKRKRIQCAYCPGDKGTWHEEWFKTDFTSILRAVNRWKMFISLSNYYDKEKWRNEVMDVLDRRYDPHGLVSDLMLRAPGSPQHSSLVDLVGSSDVANVRLKSKDRFELRELEEYWKKSNDKGQSAGQGPPPPIPTAPSAQDSKLSGNDHGQEPVQSSGRKDTFSKKTQQGIQKFKHPLSWIGRRMHKYGENTDKEPPVEGQKLKRRWTWTK